MNASEFQPYSIYYSTPQGGEGQIPIAGHHFYAEGMSIPIVAETAEEVKLRGERAAEAQRQAKLYKGKTAAELDEEIDAVHRSNMWYTRDSTSSE